MSKPTSDALAYTTTLGPGVRGGGGPKRIERILLAAIIIEAVALLYLTAVDSAIEGKPTVPNIPAGRGIK